MRARAKVKETKFIFLQTIGTLEATERQNPRSLSLYIPFGAKDSEKNEGTARWRNRQRQKRKNEENRAGPVL